MASSKLIKSKKANKSQNSSIKIYKGACVKIKNSQKTYQVLGLNLDNKICWVREWPFSYKTKKSFALEISQITIQIFCSNLLSE